MSTRALRAHKTLPAKYYTGQRIFREEKERFYFDSWICAGRSGQIAGTGDYFLRELLGECVLSLRATPAAWCAPSTTFAGIAAHAYVRTLRAPSTAVSNVHTTDGHTDWMAV